MYKSISATIVTTTALLITAPAFAQLKTPTINSDEIIDVQSEIAASPVDYSAYDLFIENLTFNENVRPKIAYKFIRKNNIHVLDEYVAYLENQNVTVFSEVDQLAYWLNVQNILVIKAILEDTKKKDIKKLRGTGDAPGKLWTKARFTSGGQAYSIYDVEQKLLTGFANPNIIYGLYQGVRGAPCLTKTAYRGGNVVAMLEANAKTYINSRGIVNVDNMTVEITPVFLWYQDKAFKNNESALLDHLKANAEPNLKSALYRGKQFAPVSLNYRIDSYDVGKQAAGKFTGQRRRPQQRPRQRQPERPSGGYGS